VISLPGGEILWKSGVYLSQEEESQPKVGKGKTMWMRGEYIAGIGGWKKGITRGIIKRASRGRLRPPRRK